MFLLLRLLYVFLKTQVHIYNKMRLIWTYCYVFLVFHKNIYSNSYKILQYMWSFNKSPTAGYLGSLQYFSIINNY